MRTIVVCHWRLARQCVASPLVGGVRVSLLCEQCRICRVTACLIRTAPTFRAATVRERATTSSSLVVAPPLVGGVRVPLLCEQCRLCGVTACLIRTAPTFRAATVRERATTSSSLVVALPLVGGVRLPLVAGPPVCSAAHGFRNPNRS